MGEAFNLAEEHQIPVILLTDKQAMEALSTVSAFDQSKTDMRRGLLVTKPADLKKLKSTDRYDSAASNGVSQRWLPGSDAAVYCAQSDEHTADGSTSESGPDAIAQMEKRMRKQEALAQAFPEPELFGDQDPEILLVGWGSTKGPVLDAIGDGRLKGKKIGYLHFTYLWPLKTERFAFLAKKASQVILIEGNYQGQLGMLLRQESGIAIRDRILKYDGRAFYSDEVVERLLPFLSQKPVLVPMKKPSPRKQ
jgi:2-oxoglutarate ferredoxin oxidoreductase subunit alpha